MALLNYGTKKGLAFRFDFNAYQQQRVQREAMDRQAQIDTENKVKYWGEKFQPGKAYTDAGKAALQEYSNQTFEKIGNLVNNNENWESDFNTYSKVLQMASSLSDNEITAAEMRVEQNRLLMAKDMASKEFDPDDFASHIDSYDRFAKRKPGEKVDEFVYIAPVKYDFAADMQDLSKTIKKTERIGTFNSEFMVNRKAADPDQLRSVARAAIASRNGNRILKAYKKMRESGSNEFDTPEEMVMATLDGFIGTETDLIARPQKSSSDSDGNNNQLFDPFTTQLLPQLDGRNMNDVKSSGLKHFIPLSEDGKSINVNGKGIYVFDNSNKIHVITGYSGTSQEAPAVYGMARSGYTGNKYVGVQYVLPVDPDRMVPLFADQYYLKPEYIRKHVRSEIPGDEIDPKFKGKITYELNSKGEGTGRIFLNAGVPIKASDITKEQIARYNAQFVGQKTQEGLGNRDSQDGIHIYDGKQYTVVNGQIVDIK
jgi:hypothetical protein